MQQKPLLYLADVRMPTEKAHGLQIVTMCDAFAQTGRAVTLIVPDRKNQLREDPFDYYALPKSFTIQRIRSIDFRGMFPGGYALSMFLFYWKARRVSHREAGAAYYSRDILAALFFPGVILELHVLPKHGTWLYKVLLRKSGGIVVLNAYARDQVIAAGISKEKVLIASDGVRLEQFTPTISKEVARQHLSLPQDKKLVVYTGHLYEWKGAHVLAEAVRYLPETIQVMFIGGTDADVATFKNVYAADQRIKVLGIKPYNEIPMYLRAADCAVLPNTAKSRVGVHYTSPLKLFEYMAVGIPIVASDLPSIRAILDEAKAYFFEPDNADALAHTIQHVLDNPEEAQARAVVGQRAVQEYAWIDRASSIALKFLHSN